MREDHYYFSTGVWEDGVCVIFTTDINKTIIEQAKEQDFDPEPYLFRNGQDINGAVILVEEPNYRANWVLLKYGVDESTIVHEIEHLVFRILSSKGLKHNRHTTEAYAYTFSYFYSQIMDIFRTNKHYKPINNQQKPKKNGK